MTVLLVDCIAPSVLRTLLFQLPAVQSRSPKKLNESNFLLSFALKKTDSQVVSESVRKEKYTKGSSQHINFALLLLTLTAHKMHE